MQLVACALLISFVLLSTHVYVYRLSRARHPSSHGTLSDYILSIRQGSSRVVIASLVNASNGGPSLSMGDFLDRWEAFTAQDYRFGRCNVNATVTSQPPYSDGIRLDWGAEGAGVSSACSDFTLNISGRGAEGDMSYGVNVTTKIELTGSYADIGGNNKSVTARMDLYNEDQPALAGPRTLEYRGNADPQTYLIRPSAAVDVANKWINEPLGWDGDNASSATETQNKITNDIYWTTWNNTDMGTITAVDIRIRLDLIITPIGESDTVTVQWWVGGVQGSGTHTIDSANDGADLAVSFDGVSEPNDGSWSWADVGSIEVRLVGAKVGGFDTITYGVDEVWGWVTAEGSVWTDASLEEDYSETDFGNGTYAYSFNMTLPGSLVEVRMRAYDLRGVFVQAETALPGE